MHSYCCTAVLIQGIHTKNNTDECGKVIYVANSQFRHNFLSPCLSLRVLGRSPTRALDQVTATQSPRCPASVYLQRQQKPREPTNQQDSNSTYSSTGIAALNSSAVLVLYTAVPSTPSQLTHHVQQYSRKAVLQYIYFLWNTKCLQSESQFQKQTPLTDCYVGHSTESLTTMRDTTRRYRQKQELWEL